jgi:mono/diheme cytochrome c family protein
MKLVRFASIPTLLLLGLASASAAPGGEPGADGKVVFLDYKCNVCHSVKAQGIEVKGEEGSEAEAEEAPPPDLSEVGDKGLEASLLRDFLRKKKGIEGEKHPKRFTGDEREAELLVQWLLGLKKKAE